MRRISDLGLDEIVDFWEDNANELNAILSNDNVSKTFKEKGNFEGAKVLNKECFNEVKKILKWLNPDMGISNVVLFPLEITMMQDLNSGEDADFFTSAVSEADTNASADATETTQASEH